MEKLKQELAQANTSIAAGEEALASKQVLTVELQAANTKQEQDAAAELAAVQHDLQVELANSANAARRAQSAEQV